VILKRYAEYVDCTSMTRNKLHLMHANRLIKSSIIIVIEKFKLLRIN